MDEKEAQIIELLSSRKVDTQLFRKYLLRFKIIDAEFWTEISDSDFEISDVMTNYNHLNYNNSLEFWPLKAELLLR